MNSAVTIIASAVVSDQHGHFDTHRLKMLVLRMKATPLNIFVGWCEALGDYMEDQFGDFYC